jgi:hypothetical protein
MKHDARTLRTPEEFEPFPPAVGRSRIQRPQDTICGGIWGNRNDICLIYSTMWPIFQTYVSISPFFALFLSFVVEIGVRIIRRV